MRLWVCTSARLRVCTSMSVSQRQAQSSHPRHRAHSRLVDRCASIYTSTHLLRSTHSHIHPPSSTPSTIPLNPPANASSSLQKVARPNPDRMPSWCRPSYITCKSGSARSLPLPSIRPTLGERDDVIIGVDESAPSKKKLLWCHARRRGSPTMVLSVSRGALQSAP